MPAYEADLERFTGYDAQVLGISVDSVPCNTAWAKSLGGLSYDLLSDFEPKGEVARAFGAYRAADGISERALFIVDKEGNVSSVEATTMKGTKLAEVAVNAIRRGPKWVPAQQNGRYVNAYREQPVTFTIQDQ